MNLRGVLSSMRAVIEPTMMSEWNARFTSYPLRIILATYWLNDEFQLLKLVRFIGANEKQKEVVFTGQQIGPLMEALNHAFDTASIGPVHGDMRPTGMVHIPHLGDLIVGWVPYEWGQTTALGIRQFPATGPLAGYCQHRRFVGVPRAEARSFVDWLKVELSHVRRRQAS